MRKTKDYLEDTGKKDLVDLVEIKKREDTIKLEMIEKQKELQFNQQEEAKEAERECWEKKQSEERQQNIQEK